MKDPSQLYLSDPDRFTTALQAALDSAVPFTEIGRQEKEQAAAEAWEACKHLASADDILGLFADAIASLGLAGERPLAKLLYLILNSRLLALVVSAIVKGASASGKNYLVNLLLSFFPPDAVHSLSGMSERALVYDETPLAHKHIVIAEEAGLDNDFLEYLIRTLLSEGHLRYITVEDGPFGLHAREINRPGPTGLISTTTKVSVHPENETRVLSLRVSDTPEQTKAVFYEIADHQAGPAEPPAEWLALQAWLSAGPCEVRIPFARQLADLTRPVALRLRRDFRMLLTLIQSHALLHRATREVDADGRIVADLDDYEAVRQLVAPLLSEGVGSTIPATIRQTALAVREIAIPPHAATTREVQERLGLCRSATKSRLARTAAAGFIRNAEAGKKGVAALYVPGDELPDDVDILPTLEQLIEACAADYDEERPSGRSASKEAAAHQTGVDAGPDAVDEGGRVADPIPVGGTPLPPQQVLSVTSLTGEGGVSSPGDPSATRPPHSGYPTMAQGAEQWPNDDFGHVRPPGHSRGGDASQ